MSSLVRQIVNKVIEKAPAEKLFLKEIVHEVRRLLEENQQLGAAAHEVPLMPIVEEGLIDHVCS